MVWCLSRYQKPRAEAGVGAGDIVPCCGDGLVAGRAFSGVGEKTVRETPT